MRAAAALYAILSWSLLACSSSAADPDAGNDGSLIVPEVVSVTALPGGAGVLELVALTLSDEAGTLTAYAALRNTGQMPACSAALSIELFDEADRSLGAAISGLLTQRFYRLTDGSGDIAACVGPGDTTMAALTDFPDGIARADVRHALYRCPYFALDVQPIEGLSIAELSPVPRAGGTAYTGVLRNELEVTVVRPSVTVFVATEAGRPFAKALAEESRELAPGDSWTFETDAVEAQAARAHAFPAGGLP